MELSEIIPYIGSVTGLVLIFGAFRIKRREQTQLKQIWNRLNYESKDSPFS